MTLDELNGLDRDTAAAELTKCCGARAWVEGMLAERPYASAEALHEASDRVDAGLGREAWLEAFTHHPKIGDIGSLRAKFANTKAWASGEQSGTESASEETLQGLADGNAAYESRFGYIFIVCATGKSADEMLGLLNARLGTDPDTELRIAAGEQSKITHLRLEKLLA
jgi:2-oxo-4-hydroxy-4-carboxy-5-ureidoimidazoline decarboxylase